MATGIGIDVGTEFIKVVQVTLSGGKPVVTGALKIQRKLPGTEEPEAHEEPAPAPQEPGKPGKRPLGGAGGSGAMAKPLSVPKELGKILTGAKFKPTGTLGVTGREINLKYLHIPPVPPEKLRLLLGIELGGKYANIKSSDENAPAITYDWRILPTGAGSLSNDVYTVLAGTAKTDYLLSAYNTLKDAGVDPEELTASAFGLVAAYLSTQPPSDETVVLCDVGHELMEIAIVEGKTVLFARSGPGGGKKFNLSLNKILQTHDEGVIRFKHERARLYPEGAEIKNRQDESFQPALREGADAIAAAIRSSVMFCRTQAKLPALDFKRVYLSGGGARMKGLCEYLEKKMGRPVQPLNLQNGANLSKLSPESAALFEGPISEMTIALGLACIDANRKLFHFTMVPEPIILRRSFWRKTVVSMVAGFLLIASLALPYYWAHKSNEESKVVVEKFDQLNKQASEEQRKYLKNVEEKKVFAATVDYYARQTRIGRVYVNLYKTINEVTPKEIKLVFIGPKSDMADAANTNTGPGVGSWNGIQEPLREFVIKGFYDKEAFPEVPTPMINQAWLKMRESLLKVPGVAKAELVPLADMGDPALREKLEKAGKKVFMATITIQDYKQPLKVLDAATTAEAK